MAAGCKTGTAGCLKAPDGCMKAPVGCRWVPIAAENTRLREVLRPARATGRKVTERKQAARLLAAAERRHHRCAERRAARTRGRYRCAERLARRKCPPAARHVVRRHDLGRPGCRDTAAGSAPPCHRLAVGISAQALPDPGRDTGRAYPGCGQLLGFASQEPAAPRFRVRRARAIATGRKDSAKPPGSPRAWKRPCGCGQARALHSPVAASRAARSRSVCDYGTPARRGHPVE